MNARLTGSVADFFNGKVVELCVGDFIPELFLRTLKGASYSTLVKRMKYGGRKGRSAARKLIKANRDFDVMRGYFNSRYGLGL